MSPATATPPKSGGAVAELETLKAKFVTEKTKADRLSRDHFSKLNRLRELHDERRRLILKDPFLVDHHDVPVSKSNAVASIDKEVRGLGDLDELGQQAAHQKRLADRANQDIREFVIANLAAIFQDKAELAAAVRDRANGAVEAAREANDAYVAFNQEMAGLLAAAGLNNQVPGLDHAAAFIRNFRDWELPLPLPEVR